MKTLSIEFEATEQEALDLAQLAKRISFSDVRENAVDDDEAYRMLYALEKVRKAIADLGINPR